MSKEDQDHSTDEDNDAINFQSRANEKDIAKVGDAHGKRGCELDESAR